MELIALETFAVFKSGDSYLDTARAVPAEEAIAAMIRSSIIDVDFRNGQPLITRRTPARTWSIGALLSCLGIFALHGQRRDLWLVLIRRFPRDALIMDSNADFRQSMHLARGLAICLRALRQKR